MNAGKKYVGIDGCPAGWLCVQIDSDARWSMSTVALDGLVTVSKSAQTALIDIPIGLLDRGPEERLCDREARRALGAKRGSSVFPAPARATLDANGYNKALAMNRRLTTRGISKQTWMITPRIKAVDDLLQSDATLRGVVRECHPEVCFWSLNGATPMQHNKKTAEGRAERMQLLQRFFPAADAVFKQAAVRYPRKQVALDDIGDAMVLALTASLGDGRYRTLPATPPRDGIGLPMEMVYCVP